MEAEIRPLFWRCLATFPLGDPSFVFTAGLEELGKCVEVRVLMIQRHRSCLQIQRWRGVGCDKKNSCHGGKRRQRDKTGGMVGHGLVWKQQAKGIR